MSAPGTFSEVDGRPAVRFVRHYPQPVTRVWDAVTAPQQLALWFPSPEVRYAERVGATIRFAGDPHQPVSLGTVLAWEPERCFAFSWGPDDVRLEVAPQGDGTDFTLTDLLDEPGAAARNAAGWEGCLSALGIALEDLTTAVPPVQDDLATWRKAYERYLAAGFPSGAAVPGL